MIQDSTVVSKSTVPVGTTSEVGNIIRQSLKNRGLSLQIDLVSNPEFLKEGNAIQDFMKPDRIIIGTENERAKQTMREVYKPFMLNHERFIFMDIFSAELSKYAANAMLATRISFMNELSQLCEKLGADIFHVRQAIGSDKRIGSQFLYPGVGYGGSCLPKDVKALVSQAKAVNIDLNVLTQVDLVNKRQKELLNHKITSYFKGQELLKGKTIGVLGLSFKPDTDDMREAPSIELINYLAESECIIKVFDPIAMEKAKLLLTHKHIQWCKDEELVAKDADALVLMTEWKQFRLLNMPAILQKMRGRAFFDGRNQYEPKEMEKYGFDYFGIGR